MQRNVVISASYTDCNGVKHNVWLGERDFNKEETEQMNKFANDLAKAKEVVNEKTLEIKNMIMTAVNSK